MADVNCGWATFRAVEERGGPETVEENQKVFFKENPPDLLASCLSSLFLDFHPELAASVASQPVEFL